MRSRVTVTALVAVLVLYLGVVVFQGVSLIRAGGWVPVTLGSAIVVIPLLGAYAVWREIQFGAATARLGAELEQLGRWPTEELPTRPSGRPERAAADELFRDRQREVEATPQDWGSWYRLGLAYNDAGDRRRARAAIRHAIALREGATQD